MGILFFILGALILLAGVALPSLPFVLRREP